MTAVRRVAFFAPPQWPNGGTVYVQPSGEADPQPVARFTPDVSSGNPYASLGEVPPRYVELPDFDPPA